MSSKHPDDRIFEFPYHNTGFDAEVSHAERVRKEGGCCSCGCCLGCLVFLILIILGLVAFYYSIVSGGVPLVVSEETTIITEPMKSDGETVDFHQAIQEMVQPNVQPDENGFMVVWRGYGREILDSIDREGIRRQYLVMCEQFGIDPQAPPTWSLPRWTPADPERWLTEVGKGLDAVQSATAGTHYFVPLVRDSEKDLVVMSLPFAMYAFHEKLSDALHQRAKIRLESDDTAGAWKDILASLRLFRHVTVNQAWLTELNGGDSESLLTPVSEIVGTLPQWTTEQLEQAIKDLESLPNWQDRQTMLRMLQFMMLDTLSVTNDFPGLGSRLGVEFPGEDLWTLQALQRIGFDWNLVAKEINHEMKSYGELLEKVADDRLEEQFAALQLRPMQKSFRMPDQAEWQEFAVNHSRRIEDNPFLAPGRSRLIGAMMGYLGTRVAGEMYRLQLIEDSRIQALRLALALEQFCRENSHYPDSLVELDLQPKMQLQYERQGNGYRIWNLVFQLSTD